MDLRWLNDRNMRVSEGEIKPDHLDLIFCRSQVAAPRIQEVEISAVM